MNNILKHQQHFHCNREFCQTSNAGCYKVVQMAWRAELGNGPLFEEVGNPKIIGEIGANVVKIVIGVDIIAENFHKKYQTGF